MVLMMPALPPAQYSELGVSLGDIALSISDKVNDSSALQVVTATMDRETLLDILNGHVFIPDDIMNDSLAKNINDDSAVRSVKVKSTADGRLAVDIDTKKQGLVQVSGTIKEFVHDKDSSYMIYHVRERNIPNHGLMSWVFSRISMSMAMRIAGGFDMPENLPVTIKHNDIKIDYSQVLADSKVGQLYVNGYRVLDMIKINKATPKDGGIDLETELDVPDGMKVLIKNALQESE